MSKKIFFQKCNFNTIYYLFYIILGIIDFIIKYNYILIIYRHIKENGVKIILSTTIIKLYLSNISDFLFVIPYFIRKKKLKNNKENEKSQITDLSNEDEEQNKSSQLIYNDVKEVQSEKRKKIIIKYTIIIAILDFLFSFIFCLYYIISDDDNPISYNDFNCFCPLYNIFQFVSSYLILKTHFYKLQYFSLFLNIGLFIIIFIFDLIIIINKSDKIDRYAYIIIPIGYLFLTVEYSFGKKVILYGYISIYLLIVMRGLIKFIFVGIFTLFMYLFDEDNIKNIIFFLEGTKVLYFLAFIILSFFENIFLWIIIDRFSPNHIPFAIIYNQIISFIISLIIIGNIDGSNLLGYDLYIRIFLYIILIIGVLIHNEILVINICGLASDTKYFLDLKLKFEELYSDADEPEILQKFETFDELKDKNKDEDLTIN